MKLFGSTLWTLSCTALLVHASCSVEDRTLKYGKLSAGSSTSHDQGGNTSEGGTPMAGDASAGAPSDGGVVAQGGDAASGGGGGSMAPTGGTSAMAGTPNGGAAGSTATAGTSSAGDTGTGAGGSSGGTAGMSAEAGTPGAAGTMVGGSSTGGTMSNGDGPCGDLNDNGVQDCQETSVKNAVFDKDVSGWSADIGLAIAWKNEDSYAQANSGSLSLTFTTAAGSQGWAAAYVHQCLAGWAGTEYELGAHAYLASDQSGNAQITVAMFGEDDCAGSFLSTATPALTTKAGAWQRLYTRVKLAPGTRSVLVLLGVAKPSSQASFDVKFDDVLFHPK